MTSIRKNKVDGGLTKAFKSESDSVVLICVKSCRGNVFTNLQNFQNKRVITSFKNKSGQNNRVDFLHLNIFYLIFYSIVIHVARKWSTPCNHCSSMNKRETRMHQSIGFRVHICLKTWIVSTKKQQWTSHVII